METIEAVLCGAKAMMATRVVSFYSTIYGTRYTENFIMIARIVYQQ